MCVLWERTGDGGKGWHGEEIAPGEGIQLRPAGNSPRRGYTAPARGEGSHGGWRS